MKQLKNQLIDWYVKNRRSLPWRLTQDPYKIWISEVMLQQTTVAAVLPYYERFLKAFPTVDVLAKAQTERVLGLWSGLGYYSRARNLHLAAKEISRSGSFPKTYADLLELRGIGPYTAAAVASIAFGEPVAAVDGNVIRVITRLYDISGDVKKKSVQKEIGTRAQNLMEGQPPALHNQAMMELGATLCTPKNPTCLICPILNHCQSQKRGTVLKRPVKLKTKKAEPWLWEMYLTKKGTKIGLVKGSNGTPWLKGTWVLPGKASLWKSKKDPQNDFKHFITHHKIFVRVKKEKPKNLPSHLVWVHPKDLHKYGLSSIVHKALRWGIQVLAMTLLSLGILSGCHSAQKTPSPFTVDKDAGKSPSAPKEYVAPTTLQLTHEGENLCGRFSYDGQRVIFQSRMRSKHSNSQIYILSFQNQKEKRVTFNDGDDSYPRFNKKGTRIIYASTTDEIKEHPEPTSSPPPAPAEAPLILGKLSGAEVYESDSDGSHIDRLTNNSGYDGEPSYSPDGRHLLFTSGRDGDLELFEMNVDGTGQKRITEFTGYDGQGVFSPDGKTILWTASRDNEKVMEIYSMDLAQKKIKALTSKPAIHWHPSWFPDGKKIIFSSNRDEETNFEIYSLNSDGTCLKRLTYSTGNDLFPELSQDLKKLLFTSNRSGANQLYLTDYVDPKDCSPEIP